MLLCLYAERFFVPPSILNFHVNYLVENLDVISGKGTTRNPLALNTRTPVEDFTEAFHLDDTHNLKAPIVFLGVRRINISN